MIGIYKITNQINGKVYIGQSVNIKERWRRHRTAVNENTNLPLYRAIQKYGLENFTFEVIEECLKKELDEKEIYWIKYYNSINPERGYNLSLGGNGGSHFNKLNYKQLQEIKFLIKNSDMLLKDIAMQFNVSIIAIKNINQGYSYYDDDEVYPLRKTISKNQHKEYRCIDCGAKIYQGSTRCNSCAGIKARLVERPTREELKNLIRTLPFTQIGKMFNVTDNTIRKWCDFEKLPRKKTEINKYTDKEWEKI